MPGKPGTSPSDFIASIFGPGSGSEHPVFVCALPNERGGHREKFLHTRDRASIDGFVAKHDRPGSAIYLCTGTLKRGAQPPEPGKSIRNKGNVAEIVALYGDTDLKSVYLSRDEIIQALLGLYLPPSIIVWSGRGAQPYWLLNEALEATPETVAQVEALNAQIADVIGGDAIHDVCRLLRMPGSHNTKEGGWLDVEVVHARLEPRYALEDIKDWLSWASPAIRRKPNPKAAAHRDIASNPFLAVASRLGFKPPIDVERRLAEMSYQGVGDTSIHNTQLAVTASLLNQGEPVEEVVAVVLDATRAAAGDDGRNWRWDREERTIRGMCADWQRKHPGAARKAESLSAPPRQKAQARQSDRGESLQADPEMVRDGTTGATVHRLEDARRKKGQPARRKADDRAPVHVVLGEAVLAAMQARGEAVIFMRKAAYLYRGGLWEMETDGLKGWLDVQIETACRALNIDGSNRVRSEARGYIQSNPDLWRDEVPWDEHGKIPTRSGLIDPRTLEIEPAQPDHYATWRVDAAYDPAATCPFWEQMVADTFADRPATIRDGTVGTIQEMLGCSLIDVKPRALSKALCFVGGSNFGKSGLLEVCSGLHGREVISANLESIETSHGTMPFMRRAPWVLHEAFDQSKWHFSSTVKAIITAEPIQINVKSGPHLTVRLRLPIFWGTNHPPQFREATRAIVNRFVIIRCKRFFDERDPIGVALEARRRGLEGPAALVLRDERSGLLNWAIAGLRRALERGAIAVTDEMRESADEIHRDSNLAAGFIEECCEFDRDMRVAVPDFCAAFAVWWLENKGEDRRTPSNEAVGKAVVALADRRIASNPKELRDNTRRYYGGIILNEQGRALWRRATEAKTFEGKTASTTPVDQPVNSAIPEAWFARPSVAEMRFAHAVTGRGDSSADGSPGTVTEAGTVTSGTVTGNLSPRLSPRCLSPSQAVDTSSKPQF